MHEFFDANAKKRRNKEEKAGVPAVELLPSEEFIRNRSTGGGDIEGDDSLPQTPSVSPFPSRAGVAVVTTVVPHSGQRSGVARQS